jgi:hypothetical protein
VPTIGKWTKIGPELFQLNACHWEKQDKLTTTQWVRSLAPDLHFTCSPTPTYILSQQQIFPVSQPNALPSRASRFPSFCPDRPNKDTRTASAKMVQNQGIDVYIAPFNNINRRYPQHGVPTISSNFTGDPNEVYIEAVDGERFIVVLDLMKDFNMYGADHLHIKWEMDQDHGVNGRIRFYTLSDLASHVPRGTSLKGRTKFETRCRKIDGDWMKCGFVFAALNIGNGLHLLINIMRLELMPDRRRIGHERRRDRERSRHAWQNHRDGPTWTPRDGRRL